jgi:general secretion pathway protein J
MELLVAAALLAMLGLIVSVSVTAIMGAIRDNREMQDRYHAARVALGRMQREIGMAYLSRHQGENQTTKTAFLGRPEKLAFTYLGHRRMVKEAFESDQGVVEYYLHRNPDTGLFDLVRREKVIIDDNPEKEGRREVLAEGVRKIRFEYWDMDKESWEDDWKVEMDRALEEQKAKEAAAASATAATGNAALAVAMVKQAERKKTHGPKDNWLPARVRVTLVLTTREEDRDLEFQTQTRVRLQEPLDFKTVGTISDDTANIYRAIPALTPPGLQIPGSIGGMPTGLLGTSPTGGGR